MDQEHIERIREILRAPLADGAAARASVEALRPMVSELIEHYEIEAGRDGGAFGRGIVQAVEGKILAQLNGRAELTDQTKVRSLGVAILDGRVVVDLRLEVSCLPV